MQILYKVSRGCYLGSAFHCNERMMKQKSKFRGQESMRDALEYAKQQQEEPTVNLGRKKEMLFRTKNTTAATEMWRWDRECRSLLNKNCCIKFAKSDQDFDGNLAKEVEINGKTGERMEKNEAKKQKKFYVLNRKRFWAVVVAQLIGQSLPTPEILGSNPVIGEFTLIVLKSVFCHCCTGSKAFV